MAANSDSPPRSVMWSIAEIAHRDGVSKPTVSIRVKRFIEQHGLTVERDSAGRVAFLNVAEYDALRERFRNPSKAQVAAVRVAHDIAIASESYDEALRQKTWLETERRRIDLDQIRGKLVDTLSVAEGYDRVSAIVGDAVDRLEERADDLAAVVANDGVRGLHAALRGVSRALRAEIASALHGEAARLKAGIAEAFLDPK